MQERVRTEGIRGASVTFVVRSQAITDHITKRHEGVQRPPSLLAQSALHGKSGWSLGVCRGPCGAMLPSLVVGGTDSLVWSVGRYALHCMVNL